MDPQSQDKRATLSPFYAHVLAGLSTLGIGASTVAMAKIFHDQALWLVIGGFGLVITNYRFYYENLVGLVGQGWAYFRNSILYRKIELFAPICAIFSLLYGDLKWPQNRLLGLFYCTAGGVSLLALLTILIVLILLKRRYPIIYKNVDVISFTIYFVMAMAMPLMYLFMELHPDLRAK